VGVVRIRNTHTHTGLSIVLSSMCYVLFSYACIYVGQGFICGYIFMAMYSFVPPFREAKFCGVPSCVFDKLGCTVGEKRLRNTAVDRRRSGSGGGEKNPYTCWESNLGCPARKLVALLSYSDCLINKLSRGYDV
jgi:hypothetical protein